MISIFFGSEIVPKVIKFRRFWAFSGFEDRVTADFLKVASGGF
jgi:hypothetical protein